MSWSGLVWSGLVWSVVVWYDLVLTCLEWSGQSGMRSDGVGALDVIVLGWTDRVNLTGRVAMKLDGNEAY